MVRLHRARTLILTMIIVLGAATPALAGKVTIAYELEGFTRISLSGFFDTSIEYDGSADVVSAGPARMGSWALIGASTFYSFLYLPSLSTTVTGSCYANEIVSGPGATGSVDASGNLYFPPQYVGITGSFTAIFDPYSICPTGPVTLQYFGYPLVGQRNAYPASNPDQFAVDWAPSYLFYLGSMQITGTEVGRTTVEDSAPVPAVGPLATGLLALALLGTGLGHHLRKRRH